MVSLIKTKSGTIETRKVNWMQFGLYGVCVIKNRRLAVKQVVRKGFDAIEVTQSQLPKRAQHLLDAPQPSRNYDPS